MSDITKIFKATVKTVRTRSKAQGLSLGPDKSILGHPKGPKSEFAAKAKNVIETINKLRDFLLEHRKDYINATSHLGAEGSLMTDAERDQIDVDAQTFMRTCSESIQSFRSEENKHDVTGQLRDHRIAVFVLIEKHLKLICNIYSQQKAVRVKRVVDKKRLGRLEPEGKGRAKSTTSLPETGTAADASDTTSKSWQDIAAKEKDSSSTLRRPHVMFDEAPEAEELTPDEMLMFELENQQLYEEMNSLMNEVKQVEGKVVEIARLQEIFADKILEQDKDVDRIADTVVGATENIKGANEEIREAMKNNAGLRVWILFFLIVCSFSLLFLDWYNP